METTKVDIKSPAGTITEIITKKFEKYDTPPFHRIGGNMDFTTRVSGFKDLYKILQKLSKPATWFWWGLVQVRNLKNNRAFYKAKDNLEAKKISKGYKELKKHDLVKRVARQIYIINPKVFLPDSDQFDKALREWNSI